MKNKPAFTMIELIFVIVVIGILAGVAIPKFAATRDDAEISKARSTLAAVRSSLSTERQKRILRGKFKPIIKLGDSSNVFGHFYDEDGDTGVSVLDYPIPSKKETFHWYHYNDTWTAYCLNDTCTNGPDAVWFKVENGKFNCIKTTNYGDCSLLE